MKQYRVELFFLLCGSVMLCMLFLLQREKLDEKGYGQLIETVGVPLDDVYIHCRYAENLLAGNGYCFNPGRTVTADTSPLWVLLVALGGVLTSHLELVAELLSGLFYLLLVIAVYRFSLYLAIERRWSVVIAILVLLSARIVWSALSGMEITLASLLVILALRAHMGRSRGMEGVLLALGIATRPEIWLLAVILFADHLFQIARKASAWTLFFANLATFIICVTPVFLLPLFERGSLIFHSSVVQGARFSFVPDWGYLWFVAKILFATVTPPFVFALLSLYYFRREHRYRLLQAFAFGLPIMLAVVAPQFRHHGRYFFPVIPLIIILGIAVLAAALQNRKPFWTFAILFLLMFHEILGTIRWSKIYAYSVTNIAGQHVAAAAWIAKHAISDDVIAAHDVGGIGYITKRPVIDLVGLVSPELYPLQHEQRLVWEKARAMGANIFIIYDRLNPTFYQFAKDSLVRQASFRVEPLVASADTVMNIYRVK